MNSPDHVRIEVVIDGLTFPLKCTAKEAELLKNAAARVDEKCKELSSLAVPANRIHLMVALHFASLALEKNQGLDALVAQLESLQNEFTL
jgi:cell division protein ZapA (FtsZ GTPase activity inhibitor)